MLSHVLAVISGSLIGFILALIGGGGSILATPLLLYVVGMKDPHLAIGTGALAVSVNAFMNLASHARAGNVRWKIGALFAATGVSGAFVGSSLGKLVDGQKLLLAFAGLMIAVALLMLRKRRDLGDAGHPPSLRRTLGVGGTGLAVGLLAGFFGIGGGFLIVPGLVMATRMRLIYAIGTSLLAVGVFGLTTAVNYAASGLVDWVVAAEYIAGGLLGGQIGLRLAVHLADRKNALNQVFAAVVILVAVYMIWRTLAG
jgi:uncharacterized membrane protein YfcA